MKRSILSDVGNCRSIIIYCTAVFRYVVVICRLFHTEICCVAEGAATFSVGFVNLGDLALNYDFLFLPSDSRNLIIFELLDYVGWVACPLRTNFYGSKSTFQIKSPLMAWWSNFVSNFHQSNITTEKKKKLSFFRFEPMHVQFQWSVANVSNSPRMRLVPGRRLLQKITFS